MRASPDESSGYEVTRQRFRLAWYQLTIIYVTRRRLVACVAVNHPVNHPALKSTFPSVLS
jgi:hypothetical protein